MGRVLLKRSSAIHSIFSMTCDHCKKEIGQIDGYRLERLDVKLSFCGRLCLIEWLAPELKKTCVPKQWIPTPEEEERMKQ